MEFKIINHVYETEDFTIFSYMPGNRPVNKDVIDTLAADISENGQLSPIVVNKELKVIDGQHRLEALISLEMPIKFIIEEQHGINEVRRMNALNNAWTMQDHLRSRVELGDERYIFIDYLRKTYDINLEIILYILAKNQTVYKHEGLNYSFKSDDPVINMPRQEAEIFCKMIHDYKQYVPDLYKVKTFQAAVWNIIYRRDKYDHERMLDQLSKYANQVELTATTRSYIKLYLNDVFNYRKITQRVTLLTDKEMLDMAKGKK